MSYIPDCRSDDAYNEKHLKHDDGKFVDGYDYAVENVVDNFFDNFIDDFSIEYTEEPEDDDKKAINAFIDALNADLPDWLKEKYTMCWKFGDVADENRTCETFWDYLRFRLLEWLEMDRDELIVSILDNYEEATDGDKQGEGTSS